MSRSIIGGLVAAVIVALTATAYLVTTSSQEEQVQKDLRSRVERARKLLEQSAAIDALRAMNAVEALASAPELVDALNAQAANDYKTMKVQADMAFSGFVAGEKAAGAIDLSLVNAAGDVMFKNGAPIPTREQFKNKDGKVIVPALVEALSRRITISEIGKLPGTGLAQIAVAPVIDYEATAAATEDTGEQKLVIIGAVVVAYPITAKQAVKQEESLGVRVAYFDGEHVSATSFKRGSEENTAMQARLVTALAPGKLMAKAFEVGAPAIGPLTDISVDGVPYVAATVRLPRQVTKDLPDSYPRQSVGGLVLVATGGDAVGKYVKPAKTFILLLGGGALVIALFGMYLVHRRLEAQIDQIELGVAEIINGNLDRTFQPIGAELDGLANGLNVMLARLLGRPEPGEEAFDENGNPIIPGKVDFEETSEDAPPPADPDLAALAEEPEPDYYKRVFTEYGAARRSAGSPDDVTFESFIAKLRVNEGKLKALHQCRAVRFRVVLKDGKVLLKPVPIF